MKIAPEIESVDRQEVVARKQLQYRLIGSLRRIAGLTLYEYDLTTGVLSVVDVKRKVEIGLDSRPVFHTQAFQRELCLYVQAMNRENAMKKVRKILRGSGYDITRLFNTEQWTRTRRRSK